MAHLNNVGYAVVDSDPNTIFLLQGTTHKMKIAISEDGSDIWKFVSSNDVDKRWVKLDVLQTVSWPYLVVTFSQTPFIVFDGDIAIDGDIVAGKVYQYTLNDIDRYRVVPNIYSPAQDAFYSTFDLDGNSVTDFIVRRNNN